MRLKHMCLYGRYRSFNEFADQMELVFRTQASKRSRVLELEFLRTDALYQAIVEHLLHCLHFLENTFFT